MRKSTALKSLIRAPLKTALTFLLVAAASFALFSRATDFAVTMREINYAKSFYRGVAALDNSAPTLHMQGLGSEGDYITYCAEQSWPTDEQLNELSSLPGATLSDTRYMTAGRIEQFQRLSDENHTWSMRGDFVLEGTFSGYQSHVESSGAPRPGLLDLYLDDIAVLAANDDKIDVSKPILAIGADDQTYYKNPHPESFFKNLKKGTRCIVTGRYSDKYGLEMGMEEASFAVIEEPGSNYLATDTFASQKKKIDGILDSVYTYDIVYTSDMRAIPRFNDHSMAVTTGRLLTKEDTNACVVHELFLEKNHVSVGDTIRVKLGDQLFHQGSLVSGASSLGASRLSDYIASAELTIVGAYRDLDDTSMQISESEWMYTINTVFVPASLLPVEIPDDYQPTMGEFSVLIEHARDIEAFKHAAEPLVAKISGVTMRFSDGGWLSVKDSFEAGLRTSFLTAALSLTGAALALLLAVYLYIGRSKKTYAIMRTLGVPGKLTRDAVVLPFAVLLLLAIPIGGVAGLLYTGHTAKNVLMELAERAPYSYAPNTAIPTGSILACLIGELAFTLLFALYFLWKMKHTPPLELLQEGAAHTYANPNTAPVARDRSQLPPQPDLAKISAAGELHPDRHYSALRQVSAWTLRHMRRGITKTALSLALAVVLMGSVGLFALTKLTYQDAFYETEVKGRALEYSSSSIISLQKDDLLHDFFCYSSLEVLVNGQEQNATMAFTNDMNRYLPQDFTVAYADGYDASALTAATGTGLFCLAGKALADTLGIHPGDQIQVLSYTTYAALSLAQEQTPAAQEEYEASLSRKTKPYTVVGIVETADEAAANGLFAPANRAAESVYGASFPFGYCEFTLADNERLDEVNNLFEQEKMRNLMYAPTASFYIDVTGLENIRRIYRLLRSMFPIAAAAAALVGLFGPGLIILQSAKEAACLRVLGVTKKRSRCMLVLEQIVLCLAGGLLVACALSLYNFELFLRSAQTLAICAILYLAGCVCGADASSIQVTRHKLLELLQRKE